MLLLVFSLTFNSIQSHATQTQGGEVSTGGKIKFYEESPPATSTSDTLPKTSTTKPRGKLPSTGEKQQKTGLLLLSVLCIGVVLLFIKKKREAMK